MLVILILASVAGPGVAGDAACAAGILAHTWAEEQGASKQLLPNPSCTTSHLLSSAEPLEPLEPHADIQRLPRLELTIGYIYYCSQHTLSAHAAAWSAWPKHERALLFFLIIDDGSPHRRTAALPPDVHLRLRLAIVRIEQDLPWNIGGARNLIFATAPTEHVLVMDMDVEVPLPLATQLLQLVRLMGSLEKEHGPQILYQFPRLVRTRNGTARNGHPAVMLLRKESYWLAGGCDEDFVGAYGNTDPHFRWRAAKTGKPATRLLRSISTIPMRLEPMQQIESGYECPMPPKNRSRNLQLFISKKAGQVAWSAEYLRFTWHVASANTNASHSIFKPQEPDRTAPPRNARQLREASAQASGAPTKQAATHFFTVLFDQLGKTVSGGWQYSQMMKLATLSMASSANLNSTLFVVVYETYKNLQALERRITAQPHMQVEKIPDAKVHSVCWVVQMELLKLAFLQRQPEGTLCIYVELDQLFLPGAGLAFGAVFATSSFDIAYTYNRARGGFGSVNTGVILFRASERVTRWLKLMAQTSSTLTGKNRCKGGENQRAIDHYVPHLNWGDHFRGNGTSIFALPYPGPLNYNTAGCCTIPNGIFVAHLKSLKKEFALSSCCRDRVQTHADVWLASCTCRQDSASSHAYCWPASNSFTLADAAWCGSRRVE